MPISPSEDLKYGDLIGRMVAVLQIQIFQLPPTFMDSVYDIVQRDVSVTIAFPIPGVPLKYAKEPWVKPASTPGLYRCLNHMYQVQQKRAEFLFAHARSNSGVVNSVLKLLFFGIGI